MQPMNKLISEKHFAFNIWDFESAMAVMDAASIMKRDVILQTSTGIYKKLPKQLFSSFIKKYAHYLGINAWLNLDHCKEYDVLIDAINSGWDIVMADGSSFRIEDNIAFTNSIVEQARNAGVLVEAEVGRVIGVEDDITVKGSAIASREEISMFVDKTNVDFLAVAFGNAHGDYRVEPNLNYDLVKYTINISRIPFVVHGGSGLSDEVLSLLFNIDGIGKINISTDIKNAYRKGLQKAVDTWKQPVDANKVIHDEIANVVMGKMRLLD